MKRFLAYSLIAAMLLSTVSCGGESGTSDTTAASGDTTAAPVETTWLDSLPADAKYNGDEFHVGWSTPYKANEVAIPLEEVSGDLVNDAVYERNRLVSEQLDINITADDVCDWKDLLTTIQNSVLAGDDVYDAYCISTWFAFRCSINGLLTELNSLQTLDLSQSWWDPATTEMHSLGSNSVYFVNGDINYFDDYATSCLVFNKRIGEEYNVENLYDVVRDGKWTYDKLYEVTSLISSDLDGNNTYDANDLYGFADNAGMMNRFVNSFGESVVVVDDTGAASLNVSEKMLDIFAKVLEQICGPQNVSTAVLGRGVLEDASGNPLFTSGHVFMQSTLVGEISRTFRINMEDDFGILPYPKYDENQEDYITSYNTAWATAFAIPTTNSELDKTGYILDTMGYFSHDTIYESVIEKNVLVKATRDNDSAEMLDILFNSRLLDLGQWGTNFYSKLCNIVISGENTYASQAASYQNITAGEFKAIPEYYDYN